MLGIQVFFDANEVRWNSPNGILKGEEHALVVVFSGLHFPKRIPRQYSGPCNNVMFPQVTEKKLHIADYSHRLLLGQWRLNVCRFSPPCFDLLWIILFGEVREPQSTWNIPWGASSFRFPSYQEKNLLSIMLLAEMPSTKLELQDYRISSTSSRLHFSDSLETETCKPSQGSQVKFYVPSEQLSISSKFLVIVSYISKKKHITVRCVARF